MKVKFLVDIGVYAKDKEVEMDLGRAEQYVNGGFVEAVFAAPPKKEVPKAEPKEEPKAKKEAKEAPKADPKPKAKKKAEEKE